MESNQYCQSCNIPIENAEMKGTEKGGTKSNEFCKLCYANGEFIHPKLTLDDMKLLVKSQMENLKFPTMSIEKAIYTLPQLKRWRAHVMA